MAKFSLLSGYDPEFYKAFIIPVGHYRYIIEDACKGFDPSYMSALNLKDLIEYCFYSINGEYPGFCSSFKRAQVIHYLQFCGSDLKTIAIDTETFSHVEENVNVFLREMEDLFRDYIYLIVDNNREGAFKLAGWVNPSSILLLRQKENASFNF